ncbi:PREDICTED: vascular endothelial growth factor C, partial [Fulmarus glacialis]|uniref:vascular endothelial growth factor C n=1 Tax=Fulmarus glacialis TaxID=30455 RepID=UPI00051ACA75
MTTKPEAFRLLKSLLELLTLWMNCCCVTELTGGVRWWDPRSSSADWNSQSYGIIAEEAVRGRRVRGLFFGPPVTQSGPNGHCCEPVLRFMELISTETGICAHASKDLEEQLRAVSSVDELMTVLYPEYWKMFKCQLRKGGWQHNREHSSFDTRSDDSLKFAAAHYNAEILKSIDTEWRKTQCMPREVCVDVGKEFGATTNTFFKPPCVSIYRCGGCCNSEGLQCMNISTNYISKTLFEITVPLSHGPKPVTVSFANHTSCRCMSKLDVYRQVHSIIRRSLPATQTQCHVANKTCPKNHIWNNQICRCLAQHDFGFSSHLGDSDTSEGFHICGPNKELDEETCQCVCKGGLRTSSCGPHKELDRSSCQCMCKNKLLPASCGPNKEFDEEKCLCVCRKTCPKHQPLNPAKCICECIESPNKCFLKGKRFHHQTC